MRGLSRIFGRFKPSKCLVTIFLLATILLNWSYLSCREKSQMKELVQNGWKERSFETPGLELFKRLMQKRYKVSKIDWGKNEVTIKLSNQQNGTDHLLDNLNEDKNAQILGRHDSKLKINSKHNKSYKHLSHVQSKLKVLFGDNQSNLNDEHHIEANFDLYPPTEDVKYTCPNNTLRHVGKTSYGRCKPHRPTTEGCREAQREYPYHPKKCKHSFQGDICTVDVKVQNGTKILRARCNDSLCQEGKDYFSVTVLNPDTGMHEVAHKYSTLKQLERNLPTILKANHIKKHNYVFLQCKGRDSNWNSQLLPLDPRYTIEENKNTERALNRLNVNIVLLDSLARDHFYRSLPKTIQMFKQLATTPSLASVFDFELFQAVEGHTAENSHALFTGSLFPPSSNRDVVRPVGMEKMFGAFKRAGYQTMWQEDLCWEGQWGLLTDLALSYGWNDLAPKLKEVHIDHTGITHSSCEVLQNYQVVSPFQGPSDKICYNGKYQHSYFLDYINENIRAVTSNKNAKPLLSYTTLNVAHDMYGRRIQTMDEDLSRFVELMAKERSTLTIILADHGNTYTSYTVTSQEGQFEMFHPSLFMIIPNEVGKLLGSEALSALDVNQRRLVTMIDLHFSIMGLVAPISPQGEELRGVFAPISSNRTCDNVELRTPNMCVCEGWDSPTTNDTIKLAFAEFAVGQLNDKLRQRGTGLPLLRSCHRLQPTRYQNVRVRNTKGGALLTSMDIVVPAGDASTRQEDIFHVEVESRQSKTTSVEMKLIHYERLSSFGVYRVCADKGVNQKLCICSKRKKPANVWKKKLKVLAGQNSRHFQGNVSVRLLDDDGCLFLIRRTHGNDEARAYEVANTCIDQSRSVILTISDVYNMKSSRDGPITVVTPPGSIVFALSAMKDISEYYGRLNVQAIVT